MAQGTDHVPAEKMQSMFRCTIKRDHVLTARSNLGPTFRKQKLSALLQVQFVDHTEVDCDDLFADMPDLQAVLPEPASEEVNDTEEDENDLEYKGDDSDIRNIYTDNTGIDSDWNPPKTTGTGSFMDFAPLKGYEYTPFAPIDSDVPRSIHTSPTIHEALAALTDLRPTLQPKRQTGSGYKDPGLDLWTRARLEGMRSMLLMYTDPKSQTYDNWGASSCRQPLEWEEASTVLVVSENSAEHSSRIETSCPSTPMVTGTSLCLLMRI